MIINNLAANIPVIGNMYTEFREELGTFIVRNNDRAEAEYGCHDDHVMCAAIGLWILKLKYVPAPVGLVVKEEESSVGTLIDLYKDLERDIKRTRAADARQVSRISANLRRARVKGRRR
jgi:hypothetical protein